MKTKLILLTIFFTHFIIGQNVCDDYNQAMKLYNEDKLQESLSKLLEVYEQKVDSSKCYRQAFNNIPYLYLSSEKEEDHLNGVKWLNKILNSNLDDKDKTENIIEPYANYKHRAALMLHNIYLNERKYKKALEYLDQAQTTYQYQTFSAGSFEVEENKLALKKAQIKIYQGEKKEAIFILLNKILDNNIFYRKRDAASFTQKDYYKNLRKNCIILIKESYSDIEIFKKNLQKSIKKLTISNEEIIEDRVYGTSKFYFEKFEFKIGYINIKSKKELIDVILENMIFDELKN